MSEKELQTACRIEQAEYGSDSIADFVTVQTWWQRYPSGIFALEHDSEIVGALGLWPLTEAVFSALSAGQMGEKDLVAEHIVAPRVGEKLEWWYLADIILHPHHRGGRTASLLLRKSLSKWFREAPLGNSMHCLALAYSDQGKSLLQKLNFQERAISPDGYPVYLFSASPGEMEQEWMKLFKSSSLRR